MKWFYDLKIGTKLLSSFAVVAAIAGLIGWVGLAGIRDMKTRSASLYYDKLVPIRDLGYANAAFLTARTEIRSMLGEKDKAKRKEFVAIVDAETKKTEAYIESYSKAAMMKEEQETLPKFRSAFEQYKKLRARIIDLSLAGKDAEALALADGEAREAQSEARRNLRELIDINVRYAELDEKTNEANAASATTKIIGFIAVGVMFALGIGLFIARAVGKPLRDMKFAAEKLALGDVNVMFELDARDELGALANSFRTMTEVIRDRACPGAEDRRGRLDR